MKKILGNVIFYTLVAGLVLIILGQLGFLPFRLMYIRSGSMTPTYQPGDLAFLYTGQDIHVNQGDVILFQMGGDPVIHRAIAIENGWITTQGDANIAPDPEKIAQADGKLLFCIPKIGYAFAFIQSMLASVF